LTPKTLPETWNLSSIRQRIGEKGDLWSNFWNSRQKLEPAVKRLEKSLK
jgi:DNA primase